MIIKFKEDEHWVMFGEIDHLEFGILKDDENCAVSNEVLVYDRPCSAVKSSHLFVKFFTKNMTEATVIHAYSPIYLMNDNGKTIETI